MVPPLSSRATHFAPSGEWLASEEAERVCWARQESLATCDAAAAAAAEAGTAVVSGERHVTSKITATETATAAGGRADAGGGMRTGSAAERSDGGSDTWKDLRETAMLGEPLLSHLYRTTNVCELHNVSLFMAAITLLRRSGQTTTTATAAELQLH